MFVINLDWGYELGASCGILLPERGNPSQSRAVTQENAP